MGIAAPSVCKFYQPASDVQTGKWSPRGMFVLGLRFDGTNIIQQCMSFHMTDMQALLDPKSNLPETNSINLAEDWKLLGDYNADNFFMMGFQISMFVLFTIWASIGAYLDHR